MALDQFKKNLHSSDNIALQPKNRGGKWYLENCRSQKLLIQSWNGICDES